MNYLKVTYKTQSDKKTTKVIDAWNKYKGDGLLDFACNWYVKQLIKWEPCKYKDGK